ncbi:MAG: hypothetical protein U0Q16_24475 [Bryobacteraceae bacterium]
MRRLWVWLLIAFVLLARLAHYGVLWVEEAYPAAAAIQMLWGKVPYRDFVFDKPPLSPLFYLLFGGYEGIPLRLAGAVYVLLCCWLAYRLVRSLWDEQAARLAAIFTAFYLTFWWPAAVMALAPDLLMLAPHLAAVWMASQSRPIAAGALAAVAFLVNVKGLFVLAACLLWGSPLALLTGFMPVLAAAASLLWSLGALPGYLAQVWDWGLRYAGSPPSHDPLLGIRSVSSWLGFHVTLALSAIACLWREETLRRWRLIAWCVVAMCGVALGSRYTPRYFFLLLPVFVAAGARGYTLLPRIPRYALSALLLIPLIRFGPRYFQVAINPFIEWSDTAMSRDAIQAAATILSRALPGDTILVWGYRPEILMITRMPLGTPWLDSQPLTGVVADRHLRDSTPTAFELSRRNRAVLLRYRPTFFIDGLGLYNLNLAPGAFGEIDEWFSLYEEVGATQGCRIYRLRAN